MTKTLEAKILDATHLELSEPIPLRPGLRVVISLTDEEIDSHVSRSHTAEVRGPQRDRELAWCHTHQDVLDQLAGEWIVVEGEELVAHGPDPARLVQEARSRGIAVPFVMYVEELRPDIVKMGL